MPTKSALASALANLKPGRSAWSRAVHTYAAALVRRAYRKTAAVEGGAE